MLSSCPPAAPVEVTPNQSCCLWSQADNMPQLSGRKVCVSEKIAVIMPSWVGDAVMATPTLRAITRSLKFGDELIGVMQPGISEVLRGSDYFAQQLLYSKRKVRDRLKLAVKLRAVRPTTVVLLTNSWWTAMVARFSGAKRTLGYARDGRGWLLSDALPALKREDGKFAPVPAIDYYLQLAERLGCNIRDRRMELTVEGQDRDMADDLYARIKFDMHRPTVVLNSSGIWGAAKVWPADHVEQLARRIVDNHPWQVLLHCGPSEKEAADAVASRINHPRVQSMGRAKSLPLGLTKSVMERASVVVSTDSGPRHIAIALDRPVVGLFGPTDPAWTRTYNVPEAEVGLQLACRGCWKKSCPLVHNRCMKDLGVETVYGGVVSAYLNHRQQRAA